MVSIICPLIIIVLTNLTNLEKYVKDQSLYLHMIERLWYVHMCVHQVKTKGLHIKVTEGYKV